MSPVPRASEFREPVAPPIEQQKLDEVPFFKEPRPRHTAMSNARLTQQLGIPMPSAEETVRRVVLRYLTR